jgi:FkbM family methyltransferase
LRNPAGDFSLGSVNGHSETTARDDMIRASVEQRRLDDFAIAGTKVLVKMDVEGHEVDVLAGGAAFISAARPMVIFENNVEGRNRPQVCDYFAACGYGIFALP